MFVAIEEQFYTGPNDSNGPCYESEQWRFALPIHFFVYCDADFKSRRAYVSAVSAYVPYKIGKLQIQGFSEPTTPKNKITELSHYAEGRPVKTTGGLFAWKAGKEAEIF